MGVLNELIHQPVRLRIMAALVSLEDGAQVDFSYLRDLLGLTDGNLGGHLRKLEEARYVQVSKTFVARKPRTYVQATLRGRDAFDDHVAALREIVRGSEAGDVRLEGIYDGGWREHEQSNRGTGSEEILR